MSKIKAAISGRKEGRNKEKKSVSRVCHRARRVWSASGGTAKQEREREDGSAKERAVGEWKNAHDVHWVSLPSFLACVSAHVQNCLELDLALGCGPKDFFVLLGWVEVVMYDSTVSSSKFSEQVPCLKISR